MTQSRSKPITLFCDASGLPEAITMIGVHRDTLKKWRMHEAGQVGGQKPPAAAIRLVRVLMLAQMCRDLNTPSASGFYDLLADTIRDGESDSA